MATWTQRSPTATPTWSERLEYQIDLWYLLTELNEIITNEEDERIVFHTWEFYNWTTNWYTRND